MAKMIKLLLPLSLVALPYPFAAQAQSIQAAVVSACGTPPVTYNAGTTQPATQDTTGKLCDSGGGGGGSAPSATVGSASPSTVSPAAGKDGSGNTQSLATSTTGVLDSPRAGTANRVVTKTNLTANTSTTVCPTATAPIATEIYFTTAGVGISLAGGTLTQATVGTTASTTPDLAFGTAATLYTLPVAATNAITAYGAAGIVVCIQTLRQ